MHQPISYTNNIFLLVCFLSAMGTFWDAYGGAYNADWDSNQGYNQQTAKIDKKNAAESLCDQRKIKNA